MITHIERNASPVRLLETTHTAVGHRTCNIYGAKRQRVGVQYKGVGGAAYVRDAYGNAMGYRDAEWNMVAEYAYDAFGRTAAQNGTMADMFAIRYSTKYYDKEAGLYYYGKRHYSPTWRRWLTRDPIGEEGGANLYGFCGNCAVLNYDIDGRAYFAVRKLGGKFPMISWSAFFTCPFMKIAVDAAANALNVEILHEQLFFEDGLNVGWGDDDEGSGKGTMIKNDHVGHYVRRDGGYDDCVMRLAVEEVKVDHYQLTWFGGRTKCNCQDYADMLRAKYRELINNKEVKCKCGLNK